MPCRIHQYGRDMFQGGQYEGFGRADLQAGRGNAGSHPLPVCRRLNQLQMSSDKAVRIPCSASKQTGVRIVFAILTVLATGCLAVKAAEHDPLLKLVPGSGKSLRDKLVDGKQCTFCPEMVVVPSGSFTMGSPKDEPERDPFSQGSEDQVRVSIGRPFAVGKFAVSFAEWDACAAGGGCLLYKPSDEDWGRGKRPVINVNWYYAKAFAAWLSSKTGKSYRLLSEAEREYVTRAGTTTPFWWGSSITPKQADYDGSAIPYE